MPSGKVVWIQQNESEAVGISQQRAVIFLHITDPGNLNLT